MKKRVLALLLSVLMTLSLLPVSAFAADLDGTGLGTEIGTVTETGEYTDTTADPDTDYEYTIVGDDGSQQTVTVTAADDTGDSSIYGTVGTETGSGTYYQLVTEGADGIEAGQQYLIVSASDGKGYALTKTAGAAEVTIANNRITTLNTDAEFTLEDNTYYGYGYGLKDSDGTYLFLYGARIYHQDSTYYQWYPVSISGTSSVTINYNNYYLLYSNQAYSCKYGTSSDLYLFHKVTEAEGEVFKVTWTTAADELLAECNNLTKDEYTEDSWNNFQTALKAAQAAHDAENFDTEDKANAALATMPALKAAKDALKSSGVIYPEIDWQRTLEPKSGSTYYAEYNGNLVRDLQYIDHKNTDTEFQTISWDDDDVIKLTTDPNMTVWDYKTDAQYSNATKVSDNISAATWTHWYTGTTENWKKADVRKISGTFTWPAGYDLDDTITLVSANDSNYAPIYEYIAANNTYSARVGDRKIIAINDDMYVYVYVDDDKPTSLTDDSYLAFYTGSVGKGIWSHMTNDGADWARTVPATYNNTYAARAFRGVYPNLATDKTGITLLDPSKGNDGWPSYLEHTNGWYTFVDGSTISTVLNNHYKGQNLEGKKVHIDIYCFDNSVNGGMDELKIMMKKAPETTATVTVEYYLDSLTAANLLGTSTMTGVTIDTEIRLDSGYDVNQLNYKKAAAIAKAGNKTVSDGVQQDPVPYIVKAGENVIKVLYVTEGTQYNAATFTYDFGVKNQYILTLDETERTATNVTFSADYDNVDVEWANGGDTATITYTPQEVRTRETIPLTLTFDAGDTKIIKDITFLPESNVMYEENMVTIADGSSWKNASDTSGATLTADKLVTEHKDAYGYTEAYADDTEFSGGSALRAKLEVDGSTDAATFNFTGTGFDLISECGTDTGMLLVGVKNANTNEAVCGYLVDTYFCGDEEYVTDEGILAYQVPVVRSLNELKYGTYTVTVAGYLASNAGAVINNSAVATQSLSNAAPSVDEIFRAAGMSEYLDAGVEVSFMDDNSVLNGGTGPAVTVTTPSFFSRVRSFFRGLASTQAATADSSSEIYAYIDAFRVYQPLSTDPEVYEPTEKGTTYYSLYDFVKNSVNDLEEYTQDVAVYIEYDGSTGVANIADYKDQGPENEVYLAPGSAIVFGLKGYEKGDTVQVSAKQIGNVTAGYINLDSTSTEMYYEVEEDNIQYAEDLGIYYVVISNDGDTGILALSALKVSSNITAVASEELGNQVIDSSKTDKAAFKPEMLKVTAPESTKVKRSYTIKVQSSKDVAYIMLQQDGEEELFKLTPTNKKAADAGKVQYYSFSKAFKQTKVGDYTYTVTAYDKDGTPSDPFTVTVTVNAK